MRGASQIPDPLLEAVDGIAVGRWRLSETGAATAHGTVRFCDNGKRKEAVSGDGLFLLGWFGLLAALSGWNPKESGAERGLGRLPLVVVWLHTLKNLDYQ